MEINLGLIIFIIVICVLGWIGFVSLLLMDRKFKDLYKFLVNAKKLSKESQNLSNVLNNSIGNLSNDIVMIDRGLLGVVNQVNDIVAAISLENKSYQSFIKQYKNKKDNERIVEELKQKEIEEQQKIDKDYNLMIQEMKETQYQQNKSLRETGIVYDSSQTTGDYDGLNCPICKKNTLSNELGQRWCTSENCGFGFLPRENSIEKKSNNENFDKVPFIEENKSIKLDSIIKNSKNENTLERK